MTNRTATQQQGQDFTAQQADSTAVVTHSFQEPHRAPKVITPKPASKGSAKARRLRAENPEEWQRRKDARAERKAAEKANRLAAEEAAKQAAEKNAAKDEARYKKAEARLAAARARNAAARTQNATSYSNPAPRTPLTEKEIADIAAEEAAQRAAHEEAERQAHNTRAEDMRSAIFRREKLIETLETSLATSRTSQQSDIDIYREALAKIIAEYEAHHAPKPENISDEERAAHNARAETLRCTIANLTMQMDDSTPTTTQQKHERETLEKNLAQARHALAKHMSFGIEYDEKFNHFVTKLKAHLSALESSLATSIATQQSTIDLQRKKLAEARRELAESISNSFTALRQEQALTKKIATQMSRITEYSIPGLENEKAAAESELSRLQRKLNKLAEESHFNELPSIKEGQDATPKPIDIKQKESKWERLIREAAEAKTLAEEAREKHKIAAEKNDPLTNYLDKKASGLEQAARAKALKQTTYEAQLKAEKKPEPRPQPKPGAKKTIQRHFGEPPAESASQGETEQKPEDNRTQQQKLFDKAAEAKRAAQAARQLATTARRNGDADASNRESTAKHLENIANTAASKYRAYLRKLAREEKKLKAQEKIKMFAISDTSSQQTEPTASATPTTHASPVEAPPAAMANAPMTENSSHQPAENRHSFAVMVAAKRKPQKPSMATTNEPEKTATNTPSFAEREMASRQAKAAQAAAAQAEANAQKKRQDAADNEARLEAIRQEVVGRMRAAREAAGADETSEPAAQSVEAANAAREAQRAIDDAARDAHRARLKKEGLLGKKGLARN